MRNFKHYDKIIIMKKNRKLFLFDIDGTLFDNKNNMVPVSAVTALKELSEVADICIASGRAGFMLYSIEEILPLVEYLVLSNGQYIVYEDKVIFDNPIPVSLLENISKELDEIGIPYGFQGSDDEGISKIDENVISCFEKLGLDLPKVNKEFYKSNNVYQAWCFCNEEISEMLKEKYPDLQFIQWLSVGYDILPKTAAKGLGMKKLVENLEMDLKDIIAFGDGDNDYEMIRDAGLGIAMGNATEKVKSVADYITKPVDEDGIYLALKHFGFIK